MYNIDIRIHYNVKCEPICILKGISSDIWILYELNKFRCNFIFVVILNKILTMKKIPTKPTFEWIYFYLTEITEGDLTSCYNFQNNQSYIYTYIPHIILLEKWNIIVALIRAADLYVVGQIRLASPSLQPTSHNGSLRNLASRRVQQGSVISYDFLVNVTFEENFDVRDLTLRISSGDHIVTNVLVIVSIEIVDQSKNDNYCYWLYNNFILFLRSTNKQEFWVRLSSTQASHN